MEAPPAAAGCGGRRRFAVACGVLSRFVRAEAAAGSKVAAAEADLARPVAAASTMLLMPGADVGEEEAEATPAPAPAQAQAQAQLTIMYGGRVLVLDDVPVDKAAELLRVAAGQQVTLAGVTDVPVARKGSLQRFMQKRRDRIAERSPYAAASQPPPAEKGKEGQAHAGCRLELGIAGGKAR